MLESEGSDTLALRSVNELKNKCVKRPDGQEDPPEGLQHMKVECQASKLGDKNSMLLGAISRNANDVCVQSLKLYL